MSNRERKTEAEVTGGEQSCETEPQTCTNCGFAIDEYEWFPIRGRTDGDGEFRIYSFCSEECVESWQGP